MRRLAMSGAPAMQANINPVLLNKENIGKQIDSYSIYYRFDRGFDSSVM